MSWQERIVLDPAILTGKPTVKGTRIAVEFVVDLLGRFRFLSLDPEVDSSPMRTLRRRLSASCAFAVTMCSL